MRTFFIVRITLVRRNRSTIHVRNQLFDFSLFDLCWLVDDYELFVPFFLFYSCYFFSTWYENVSFKTPHTLNNVIWIARWFSIGLYHSILYWIEITKHSSIARNNYVRLLWIDAKSILVICRIGFFLLLFSCSKFNSFKQIDFFYSLYSHR